VASGRTDAASSAAPSRPAAKSAEARSPASGSSASAASPAESIDVPDRCSVAAQAMTMNAPNR
jgi:hypothetical protein